MLLDQIAGALQCGGAFADRRGVPRRKAGLRRRHRRRDDGLVAFLHGADAFAIDRRQDVARAAGHGHAVDQRRGVRAWRRGARSRPAARRARRDRRTRRPPNSSAPARTDRAAAEYADGARAPDRRSSFAAAAACLRSARSDRRPPRRRMNWRRSPAAAAPDRRADRHSRRPAHRRGRSASGISREQRVIERLAHAVQPLEFVAVGAAGVLDHARHRQRVVGGELRIEPRPRLSSLRAQSR